MLCFYCVATIFIVLILFFSSLTLLIMGIFAKFAAAIVAIPDPIMGGMTTFLYSSVLVSGLAIVAKVNFNRRNRFIFTASMALGYVNISSCWRFIYILTESTDSVLHWFLPGSHTYLKRTITKV